MPHSLQNCEADQLVEPITGINEHFPTRIYFLYQYLCGSQCPYVPLYLSLYLSPLVYLHLHF